jgi:triosephosphate isomerase
MLAGTKITPPFFEFGPKAYLYGRDALALARHAEKLSAQYGVQIIYTPQFVDIPILARETKLLIFAQHMDPLPIGRGVGSILPEAVKAAGAAGVLLNHAEKKLTPDVLERTLRRAEEVGLISMVCADNLTEAAAVARMRPDIIIAEAPELIGVGKRGPNDRQAIAMINATVWNINPDIRVLHGAGISNGQDVYAVIAAGAQATGSSSGIANAQDRFTMFTEMIRAVRQAWDNTHPEGKS